MVSSGFRNSVDIAINREGELFTYDSDLEFDIGSPWYRPTRVNHVTSASEFGSRPGSAKWPEYFADSNGAVINVGPGSPTALSFGHHSNFPDWYQDKLFCCDWTFGTIYTVDMEESGSSYTGTKKEFLNGTPLNIAAEPRPVASVRCAPPRRANSAYERPVLPLAEAPAMALSRNTSAGGHAVL